MNKRILKFSFAIFILVLLVISILRIDYVNKQYPNTTIIKHKIGEVIKGGETAVKVNSYKIINYSDLKKTVPDYKDDLESSFSDDQIKHLLVNVQFINLSEKKQTLSIPAMLTAQTLTWSNGLDIGLFQYLNPEKDTPMMIEIDSMSTVELILPYTLYYSHFKNKDWNEVQNKVYQIPLSMYPVKHVVELQK